jgi:hypothetical protein
VLQFPSLHKTISLLLITFNVQPHPLICEGFDFLQVGAMMKNIQNCMKRKTTIMKSNGEATKCSLAHHQNRESSWHFHFEKLKT